MSEIPQTVAALLEPVSSASPTGADDLSRVEAFVTLDLEFKKPTPDYVKCIDLATKVLKNNCKHARVAAWLCFAWYRQEKMAGLRNGLLLLAGLLERFGERLHPQDAAQRQLAIQFLNTSRVTALLGREKITETEAPVAQAALAALRQLDSVCRQQFPENGPMLSAFAQVLEKHAKTANGAPQAGAVTAEDPNKVETKVQPPSNESGVAAGDIGASEKPATVAPQELAASPEAEKEKIPLFEIPDFVNKLLQPISAQAPAGKELAGNELYHKLQMEIGKIKPNYDLCQAWAEELLKDQSKDLNVLVWLCFVWYRKEKEEIAGLKNGMLLLWLGLLQFGDKLYPVEAVQRGRAFNFLNRKLLAKMVEKEKIDGSNAAQVLILQKILQLLHEEYGRQFSEELAKKSFKELREAVAGLAETATKLLQDEEQAKKDRVKKEEDDQVIVEDTNQRRPQPDTKPKPPPDRKPETGASTLASEREALLALKKALAFFFEEQVNGNKKRKIPEDVTIYGLSRQLLWAKQTGLPPADKEGVTQMEGPSKEKQALLQKHFANKSWEELIPDIELRCLCIEDERFKFWLDAQRLVVQGLENKGGKAQQAAEEIKFHLTRLINRLPGLAKLKFKDKTTAFADKETMQWLEEEVKGIMGGKGEEAILPPILGEEYEPINKEYEAACALLPENFEKNAEAMQKAIAGDIRRKGRFLRALNLANFCLTAKKYELAKALLTDLLKKIDEYQLSEWEPALCTAAWQSTYLANVKLLQSDDQALQKTSLLTQQKELFERISLYDSLRALTLANRQPKEGE